MASKNFSFTSGLRQKAQLMSASEVERTRVRLAHEIVEKNGGLDGLELVGAEASRSPSASPGSWSGWRKRPFRSAPWTSLFTATTLARRAQGRSCKNRISECISKKKNIVLVDDVLFTGRTVRAALDALFSRGRRRRRQLCVLIDRGHRELPIAAAFIGRNVRTATNEVIEVKLTEVDNAEKVLLMEK